MKPIVLLAIAVASAQSLVAQANVVPGLNGRIAVIDDLFYWGRRGPAYPGGEVGVSMQNEMCNPGSVNIPWQVAMASNHPKFGFLLVRVAGGRMEQINDWSYCKHAFTSTNYSGPCGTCQDPGTGQLMGINCADTYGSGNNGDRYWLGPPSEIDPWLGTWAVVGSYFDRGDPAVAGAAAIDGVRSLTTTMVNAFDAVKNRMTVKEADLITAGAQYYYGIQLIHQGEAVANRGDNLASRGTTPSWNGSTWSFPNNGNGQTYGSILTRWPGAEVNAGQNGNDDGRFFVGCVVTPLGGGNYHYEYAVHNVDNRRGGATFRLPIDAGATASNFTFGDIDANPLNDWTGARVGNQVVFTAPANNPLNWNTIYNFGFDANFPPGSGLSTLDEALVGPGALTVDVATKVPSGSTFAQWTAVGTGCGGTNCQSSFYELFSPASAFDLANTSWSLTYSGGNYTLGPGTGSYVAPAGTNLTMGDDVEVSTAIPFALPTPAGPTSTLWVCSNGFVSSASNGSSYTPSSASFLAGNQQWAALWHDLLPSTGMVKVDSSAAVVRISFTAVPNYGTTGTATFQYQFFPNGNVNVIYQAVGAAGNDYLVGYTRGGNGADPGSWNISAGLAGGLSLCSGPIPNLSLSSSARPILGTTINLTTANIPAGSVLGISILSATPFAPAVNLGVLNMPNCFLYQALDVVNTFAPAVPSASSAWAIPNVPSASGAVIHTQSAVFNPAFNAFGAATTNGVQLLLGVN
ncbi:MAG: hypothetical protein WAT39_16170 [Planctomycetota bacterium]